MLERLKELVGRKAQDRKQFIAGTVRPADTYTTSRAPQEQEKAIKHLTGYVYAATMLNARSIASQPLRLYARLEGSGRKRFASKSVNRNVERYLKGDASVRPAKSVMSGTNGGGEVVEIYDHPILDLLANVSPFIDGYQFNVLRKIMLQATGNEYLHPIIGPTGYPIELHVLPSQLVKIEPTRDEHLIDGYVFGYPPQEVRFEPDEVLHNKTPNPEDAFYGRGWVSAAQSSASLLESMDDYEHKLFDNHARPDWGIFLKDNLNETQWNRMVAYIDQNLRGNYNAGRPYIFEGGSDARPLQFSPRDLSFSEGELRKVEAIAAISGVPVSLLRANDPNLASAEVGFASYMRDTIHPYLVSDCEFLNQSLLPLFGDLAEDLFLAYDNPVVEDEERSSRIFLSEVNAGVRSINEARSELGLDPVDDGDELRVNGVPLSQAGVPQLPLGQLAYGQEEDKAEKAFDVDGLASKIARMIETRSVRVGSFVEWRTPKGNYVGKVERIQREGTADQVVGDSNEASEDNPIAHVRVFVRLDDGSFEESDRQVPVAVERLDKTEEPEMAEKAVSDEVKKALEKKVKEHNEEVGDAKSKRATLRMLIACYERGIGAYRTNPGSVRPTVSGEQQWAMGRVNGLLHALRTGKFKKKPYDQDLLPEGHPLSSKDKKAELDIPVEGPDGKVTQYGDVFTEPSEALQRAEALGCNGIHEHDGEEFGHDGPVYMPCDTHENYERAIREATKKYEDIDFTPPKGVREEAALGLEWRREHNRGGTEVGVARARDLSNGERMSPDTVRRMANFFSRHEVDKEGEGFTPGEDGYPSAGRIAWALWGGDPGKTWADSLVERMNAEDERGEKVTRRENETLEDCVARGVEKITAEGYPRDQAIAIAYSQCETKSLKRPIFKTCTGLEPGVKVKSSDLEDWHPTQKAARILVEEVDDDIVGDADEGVEREGEPKTPATRIAREVAKILKQQRERVVDEVKKIGEKSVGKKALSRADIARILALIAGDTNAIEQAVIGPMLAALDAGSKFAGEQLGEAANDALFRVVNRNAVEYAEAHAASLAKGLQQSTIDALRGVISRGVEQGFGIDKLTEEITTNGRIFNPDRARIIARTETARAFNQGNLETYNEVPYVAGKRWIVATNACKYCVEAFNQSRTNAKSLNEPFVVDIGKVKVRRVEVQCPPLHPNCRCGIQSVRREVADD